MRCTYNTLKITWKRGNQHMHTNVDRATWGNKIHRILENVKGIISAWDGPNCNCSRCRFPSPNSEIYFVLFPSFFVVFLFLSFQFSNLCTRFRLACFYFFLFLSLTLSHERARVHTFIQRLPYPREELQVFNYPWGYLDNTTHYLGI